MARFLDREKPLIFLIVVTLAIVFLHRQGATQRRSFESGTKRSVVLRSKGFFATWRRRFIEIQRDTDSLGLVRGIFLGDDDAVSPKTREVFKKAGLYHLLAASGFNCWIVAMFFALLCRIFIFAIHSRLKSTWALGAKIALLPLSKLLGAWTFWAWSDHSAPITRSAILVSSKFVLEAFGIVVPFGRLLFVQYLASLVLFPKLWGSASFQLTFACLFGMTLFPMVVQKCIRRDWTHSAVAQYFISTLGASFGAAPVTWIFFYEINFSGIFTNWFAIPIVSFLVMPLALLTMFLVPFELVADLLAWVSAKAALLLWLCTEKSVQFIPYLGYKD